MTSQKIFKAKIDDRGRIYLPRTIRQQLKIKNDQMLIIITNQESFTVYPNRAIEQKLVSVLSKNNSKLTPNRRV